MSDLLELAARCEAAIGADRDLDMAICLALDTGRRVTGDGRWLGPDPFTASLDAAMTLVPDGWDYGVRRIGACGVAHLWRVGCSGDGDIKVECDTPALALCAAALRARASTETTNDRA